jgi:hypothetical protein
METVKWVLKEQFDKQDEKFQMITARYQQAVIDAGTRVQDLKAEQEALLRTEFQTGKDLSADKAAIRAKIETAQKELEAAEIEKTQAYVYARTAAEDGRITVRDLLSDWNGPYRQTVREQEFKPIFERMDTAGSDYLNALLDYFELVDRYTPAYSRIHTMAHEDNVNHPGDNRMPVRIAEYGELPLIGDTINLTVEGTRELPFGIKRVRTNGGEA